MAAPFHNRTKGTECSDDHQRPPKGTKITREGEGEGKGEGERARARGLEG